MSRRPHQNTGQAIRDPGSTMRCIYRHPGSRECDRFVATHTAPVPADSPVIARWSTLAPDIIDRLNSWSIDWAAVECFHRLYKHAVYSVFYGATTVMITIREGLSIPNQLNEMMEEICLISGCRVELQFSNINLIDTAQQTETALSLPNVVYPPMGSRVSVSTGLEDPTEATVGGILRLVGKDTGEEEYFALTCFHNLPTFQSYQSRYIDLEPGKRLRLLLLSSTDYSPTIGDARRPVYTYGSVRCAFPSQLLQADIVSGISADIHRVNTKMGQLETEYTQIDREELNQRLPPWLDEYVFYQSKLQRLKESAASIHSIHSDIGIVAATSGLPVHNGKHLDWALISLSGLDTPPRPLNAAYNVQERVEIPVRLSHWSNNLEGGAKVYKPGSTSVTEGVVNSVPSYVRFRETQHSLPVAKEWAVIPVAKYKSFSGPGDSGAWVVDHLTNHVLGMILGRNGALGVSYVTPIREIINHIEHLTNKVMDMPN